MAEPNLDDRQSTPPGSTVLRHKLSRAGYVKLANKVARDTRLSYRARGVLIDMISRPPDWKFSAERIARNSPKEGRDAIQTAMRELEAVGYLLRYRERLPNGRFQTVVMVSDLPLDDWAKPSAGVSGGVSDALSDGVPEGFPETPSEVFSQFEPTTAKPASAEPSSKEGRGYEEHTDMTRPQLPSLAGETPSNFNPEWRDADRQRFADILGVDRLKADGRKWSAGTFTVDAFYTGYRKIRGKKWPGLWLEGIEDSGQFEDWLIDEGLTLVETTRR